MVDVLIIGYGNPLRGDDGLGPSAAHALRDWLTPRDSEILTPQQLTPDLAWPISRARRVVFIDARADPNADPGAIRRERLLPAPPNPGAFSHHVAPSALLAYAETLYGASPQAVLFSVASRSFGLMEPLSEPVARAMPDLLQAIRAWLRETNTAPGSEGEQLAG